LRNLFTAAKLAFVAVCIVLVVTLNCNKQHLPIQGFLRAFDFGMSWRLLRFYAHGPGEVSEFVCCRYTSTGRYLLSLKKVSRADTF
jgi:hypothetical protein